jgi:multidrug efflux pump subunit AcrA (membrane-fusion protein)
VFRVDGDRVRAIRFVPGDRLGDVVSVRSGLQPGDRVVLDPPATLLDGALVRVTE